MRRGEAFPSKYIGWEDLGGRDITVTIARAQMEPIKNPESGATDNKLVLYFDKTDKGMVCNLTNWDRIETLHGGDTDDWVGKRITLTTERTRFGNKEVNGLRVKLASKQGIAKPFPPRLQSENPADSLKDELAEMDDEIPF